jgi:hypothetical protein
MFIKRSISKQGGKTYVSHVLVESVLTPAGPRHKTICNLGKMDPGPKEDWLLLAERIQMALGGQSSLFPDPRVDQAVAKIRERQAKASLLEGSLVLYDMTNTYFEGQAARNPKAKRGHSKEMRTDCKLVAMGLMLDADGFPIGHEVHAGNTIDGTTVKAMLDGLEARTGRAGGSTVVMDRGFASADNLKLVRERHYDYLVAGFQQQRNGLLKEFEDLEGWEAIQPSANKVPVQIKQIEKGDEVFLLCVSQARAEKERTIRKDMGPEEIWRTYIVLTRIESAFRDLKGTLDMRPVHHQKEIRVETHVVLAVLAFHLQAVIERTLKEAGDHTSWETPLREELGTHHVVTTLLPTADGKTLAIRRGSVPDGRVGEIYRHLNLDPEPMTPIRTWL